MPRYFTGWKIATRRLFLEQSRMSTTRMMNNLETKKNVFVIRHH